MEGSGHHAYHADGGLISTFGPLLGLLLIALVYCVVARKQFVQGKRWRLWRIGSFLAGIALVAVGVSPSMMEVAHHSFEGHMFQHLLIGMLAPIALVMGAPVTLLLRSVSVENARRFTRFLKLPPVQVLTHPVTALVLNIGGMALLYATPIYAKSADSPVLHHLIHVHFLLAGYLYSWAIAGPDPAPGRPSFKMRLLIHFVGMGLHANLSKWMYGFYFPRGTHHSIEDIQAGAKLMFYGGDAAELLLAVVLFATWYRASRPMSRVANRKSETPCYGLSLFRPLAS